MMPVLPTSSTVDRPWKSISLPPGMATPYWCNLTISLRMAALWSLRTDLAPDLAHHSPLRMSIGVILPGFPRNIPPDPRIHILSLGSSPVPAVLKKVDRVFLSLLVTHFFRTVIRSVMNSGLNPDGPGPDRG
eukprot:6995479-Heterocapsa_arctica.AAC.1